MYMSPQIYFDTLFAWYTGNYFLIKFFFLLLFFLLNIHANSCIMYNWIYFTWPLMKQAAYKTSNQGTNNFNSYCADGAYLHHENIVSKKWS